MLHISQRNENRHCTMEDISDFVRNCSSKWYKSLNEVDSREKGAGNCELRTTPSRSIAVRGAAKLNGSGKVMV